MSWESWEKSAERGPYSIAFKVLFFLMVLGFLTSIVVGACHFACKPIQVLDKVTDPDRMIYTYEWFHTTNEAVKAATSQISIKEEHLGMFMKDLGPRKDWGFEDKREYSRVLTELNGLRAHRASLVREYNARSNMITRDFLKGRSLPEQLQE